VAAALGLHYTSTSIAVRLEAPSFCAVGSVEYIEKTATAVKLRKSMPAKKGLLIILMRMLHPSRLDLEFRTPQAAK
jgi:hypothetical protein